jgi:hypothetical protein
VHLAGKSYRQERLAKFLPNLALGTPLTVLEGERCRGGTPELPHVSILTDGPKFHRKRHFEKDASPYRIGWTYPHKVGNRHKEPQNRMSMLV